MLGFGASGEVWRAREDATGAAVALQRLRGGAGSSGCGRLAALPPAALRGRLREVLDDDRRPVLVLDHAGGRLAVGAAAPPRAARPGEVVTVGVPLARALAAAHGAGLVHGALSAPAVLLTADGMPLLGDRAARGGTPAGDVARPRDAVRRLLAGPPLRRRSRRARRRCRRAPAALVAVLTGARRRRPRPAGARLRPRTPAAPRTAGGPAAPRRRRGAPRPGPRGAVAPVGRRRGAPGARCRALPARLVRAVAVRQRAGLGAGRCRRRVARLGASCSTGSTAARERAFAAADPGLLAEVYAPGARRLRRRGGSCRRCAAGADGAGRAARAAQRRPRAVAARPRRAAGRRRARAARGARRRPAGWSQRRPGRGERGERRVLVRTGEGWRLAEVRGLEAGAQGGVDVGVGEGEAAALEHRRREPLADEDALVGELARAAAAARRRAPAPARSAGARPGRAPG